MLKIKLTPIGKKHAHHYKIVVAEENTKLTSSPVEVLGQYHPSTKEIVIDKDLLAKWLKNGAQPTDTIRDLLKL